MTVPNLIHPVPVKIQQIRKDTTVQDNDFREPVQRSKKDATETLQAQIAWKGEKILVMSEGGAQEQADGYVLFRSIDLQAKSITLQQNDRIIEIGTGANKKEVDLYIIKLQPIGHYPDRGGSTLVKAFFEDRQPSRQRLDL